LIIVAPWVLHRHRLLWKNPDEFQPERFLPGAREKIDRFAYLPVGAGPRVCIGKVFAMQEAIIVLASILRRVRLRLSGPPPQPVHRITLRPSPRLAMSVERLESV
ncbi:MAG: cytochrome P450, partial [Beijerinckiaceae bacterium]